MKSTQPSRPLRATVLLLALVLAIASTHCQQATNSQTSADTTTTAPGTATAEGPAQATATGSDSITLTEGTLTYTLENYVMLPGPNNTPTVERILSEQHLTFAGNQLRMEQPGQLVDFIMIADFGSHNYWWVLKGKDTADRYVTVVPRPMIEEAQKNHLGGVQLGKITLDTTKAPKVIAGQRCVAFKAEAKDPEGGILRVVGYVAPHIGVQGPWDYFLRAGGLPSHIPGTVFEFAIFDGTEMLSGAQVTAFKPGKLPNTTSPFSIPKGYKPLPIEELLQLLM